MAYENTDVSVSKSQDQLRKTIMAHKGSSFMCLSERANGINTLLNREGFQAMVVIEGKVYTIRVMATLKDSKRRLTEIQTQDFNERESRRIWRVLYYHMKSVFEAADSGVMEFRELMLPYVVVGDGRTIAQHILPKLAESVAAGRLLGDGQTR
jgi:hypothetical protein